MVTRLAGRLEEQQAEAAHLKVIGLWEGFFGVANLVSSEDRPELSLPSNCQVRTVDMIVNARVACDPEWLENVVRAEVVAAVDSCGASVECRQVQSFRPGRPEPTHRFDRDD